MSLLDNLPHLCTIQLRRAARDGFMGVKTNPQVVQSGVECWQQQASANEILRYEKMGIDITSKVYFTSNPNVTEAYQILITSRNGVVVSDPIVLDVKSIADPDASAGLELLWRVMVNENTGDRA